MAEATTRNVHCTISNTSVRRADDCWLWKLSVGHDQDESMIESIAMRLHPTFPNPFVALKHRSANSDDGDDNGNTCLFESSTYEGWGTFVIDVTVVLKGEYIDNNNKRRILQFQHELVFSNWNVHSTHHTATIVARNNQSKHSAPPSSMWCITYQQLMDVEKQASETLVAHATYLTMTMRDVCREIIEPSCARTGTSYALSLNKEGLPIDVFVSHSWDGCFAAFVQSIRNAFPSGRKPNLWICAFALTQGQSPDLIRQQVGSSSDPLDRSPFVQAIQAASTFCVVRNSKMDVYCRIWCVCELMYAKHSGLFPSRTQVTGPDVFAQLQTSVLDAQASKLQDRDRILRVLLTEFNREEIDDIVHEIRNQDAPEQHSMPS